jgi:hypothetical protein
MNDSRLATPRVAPPDDPIAPPARNFRVEHAPPVGLGARLSQAVGRAVQRPGPRSRLGGAGIVVLLATLGLVALAASDQVVPASSAHQAQIRIWLASRAAGLVALGLLSLQIVIGLVMSHPTNKSTWRLSARIFAWHDTLWLFVIAFVVAHVVAIVLDPYAGVGLTGALVPGLSSYRSAPVALGSLALDALLVTGITARWTRLLPPGVWLVLHRASLAIFVLAWMHGLLAGTDSPPLTGIYLCLAAAVGFAALHRFWAVAREPEAGNDTGPGRGREAAGVGARVVSDGRSAR